MSSAGLGGVMEGDDVSEIVTDISGTAGGAGNAARILLDTTCLRYADDENDFRDDIGLCVIRLPLFT